MEEEKVRKILIETWDTIADSWTHLRARPQDEVLEFANLIDEPGLLLDIGCGNGRNLLPFLEKQFSCIGMDFSKGMIREAKKFLEKKEFSAFLLVGDALSLPFKEDAFDCVLYVRALHHIPTKELRISSLKEVKRVLKKDGKILISVWKRYYPQFIFDFFSNLFEKKFEFGDTYKKWRYHGKVYKRFYHLYSIEELKEELEKAELFIPVVFPDDKNIIARKV